MHKGTVWNIWSVINQIAFHTAAIIKGPSSSVIYFYNLFIGMLLDIFNRVALLL